MISNYWFVVALPLREATPCLQRTLRATTGECQILISYHVRMNTYTTFVVGKSAKAQLQTNYSISHSHFDQPVLPIHSISNCQPQQHGGDRK